MNTRTPYSYTVLRYVHDITTGEFINVGVVVSSPDVGFLTGKFKSAFTRVKSTFPTLRGDAFRSRVRKFQAKFDALQKVNDVQLRFDSGKSILDLVHDVLPADDSSFQWSQVGSGSSRDLTQTVESLYQRFVTKYDSEHLTSRRGDYDVWREFKSELEKRQPTIHLKPKTIEVDDDGVRFEHAWKNGAWHCYEPLSFDLASGASIKGKAHRWLGQLASLQGAKERFSVHFLVAKPSELYLVPQYEQAISILKKGTGVNVVEESQLRQFSQQVAQEMAEHAKHALIEG